MSVTINVQNLKKRYHDIQAVNDLSFTISKGEIVGMLGPNGAGKSTTINILATVLKPDSGNVTIAGHDLQNEKMQIKRVIGIVPQDLAIYDEISAEKNVRFFASLYGVSGARLNTQVQTALKVVGLYDRRKAKPKTFSGGMKRRLNIACAIAHQPDIIIMDEPTVGIDPQSRNHILETIIALREKGATIIYSTHYMEEVEAIADRVLILNDGAVIASGTTQEICKGFENQITYSFQVDTTEFVKESSLSQIIGVKEISIKENRIQVVSDSEKNNLNEIISTLISNGCDLQSMSSEKASLETVFLDLTGKKLRD
ncbi:ABC transporter ATP-binding protein [Lachnospiraceae bacterium OttesenSCG-928-D06]|nr:ABC transporter ATP-binding protein [Lachnospiraceae bacterium OttesenSCG-928-D06]